MTCSLRNLPEKTKARVVVLDGESHIVQQLMGMGVRNNIFIKMIRKLFFGNNYIVEVGNEHLVLRKHEAQCLRVTTLS